METVNESTGLTSKEETILQMAADLWGYWISLPVQHRDDKREICDLVHQIQYRIAIRVARRGYPNVWSNEENNERD